jgi:hypothetical protein
MMPEIYKAERRCCEALNPIETFLRLRTWREKAVADELSVVSPFRDLGAHFLAFILSLLVLVLQTV